MAKDPWHRFSTAKEYSETLQKALRGETLERFDRGKIQPRIDRAKKAQAAGDHQFASEILSELEAEGNIDPEMSLLRIQIDQAIRQKSIRQLLESARTRLEEDEFPAGAAEDPGGAGDRSGQPRCAQLAERHREAKKPTPNRKLVSPGGSTSFITGRTARRTRDWRRFSNSIRTTTRRARFWWMSDRREKEVERSRKEKEQLYQGAMSCYQRGEVSSALTKLERISGSDAALTGLDDSRPRCAISKPLQSNPHRTGCRSKRLRGGAAASGRQELRQGFGTLQRVSKEVARRSDVSGAEAGSGGTAAPGSIRVYRRGFTTRRMRSAIWTGGSTFSKRLSSAIRTIPTCSSHCDWFESAGTW